MSNHYLNIALITRINQLNQRITALNSALAGSPEGLLKVHELNGHFYYEYISHASPGTSRYLSCSVPADYALAQAIAQRDYDRKVEKMCHDELRVLRRTERFYQKGTAEDIASSLHPGRRALITPIWLTDEEYAADWQARHPSSDRIPDDAVWFPTERGERVRSKTEMFIGNKLHELGVPYSYEYPIELVDHITGVPYTAHPDFLVLNTRTRKVYLWEHLGDMDNPQYVNKNLNRLIDYEEAGFIPYRDIILSFETKLIPYDPIKAERLIRRFFM